MRLVKPKCVCWHTKTNVFHIPTNIPLDNESGLSQGIRIFVGLIDIETAIHVRSMRHGRNESSNCHITMLQLCLI